MAEDAPQPWLARVLGRRFLVALCTLAMLYLALFTASVVVRLARGHIRVADFAAFYTAGRIVARDGGAAPYVLENMIQGEKDFIKPDFPFPIYWNYPPVYYFWVRPLALTSYHPAFELWVLAQFLAYLLVLVRPRRQDLARFFLISAPAVLMNVSYGQNGMLLAALLGFALAELDERPALAGAALGTLVFKPHLVVMAPLALAAGRRWRALAATVASAGAWCLASLAIYGWGAWVGFYENVARVAGLLKAGRLPLEAMPSAYAMVMEPVMDFSTASTVQSLFSVTTVACVLSLWWKGAPRAERSASLALAALLTTPWTLVYDLAILAVPFTWIALDPDRPATGWFEAALVLALWLAPVAHSPLVQATGVSVTPVLLLTWLLVITRRGLAAAGSGP